MSTNNNRNKTGTKTRKRTISPKSKSDITQYQFKPGNPGGGRPKLSELERAARESSREEIAALKSMTVEQARTIAGDKDQPITRRALANALIKANAGDFQVLNWFYDRLLGRPKQTLEHETPDGPLVIFKTYASDGKTD